jgi:hypothetical protein
MPSNLVNRGRRSKKRNWGTHASYAAYRCMRFRLSLLGQTQRLFPLCLLPVTRHPDPAPAPGHPLAFDPYCRQPWTHYPTARHPDIGGSSPSPITPRPGISGSRCHRLRFNSNGWWSPGHYHLSGWTGCCHFLCSCRSCHGRRLGGAAHQCKWCQRQQINAFSHIRLLFLNSFYVGNSALLEMKPARPVSFLACVIDGKRSILPDDAGCFTSSPRQSATWAT